MKIIHTVQNAVVATSDGKLNSPLDGHVSDALYHLVLVSFSPFLQWPTIQPDMVVIIDERGTEEPSGETQRNN
jgi:hypothetical protein